MVTVIAKELNQIAVLELKKEKKAAHTQLFGNKNEENSLSRKSAGQQNQVPWGKRVT